jgi:formylglycine-generating enzyme required for sulfatase activity
MIKKLIVIFISFLFLALGGYSQSKKEQIAVLQLRVDSLNQVLSGERENRHAKILELKYRIDSLVSELNRNSIELKKTSAKLSQCEGDLRNQQQQNDTQKKSFIELNQEYNKLKQSADSLERIIAQLQSLNTTRFPFEPELVFVEGGTFQMGSSSGESDEQPVHSVTLSSFNIGKYEVTQAQWIAVMGSNPSSFSGCDNCPVEEVSWNEVQEFIRKLNAQTGKNYRLPTEAEWEYAARGGKQSRGYTYSGSNDLGSVASNNSGSKKHAVGGKQANELGIYDMSGNVSEWCSDWYGNYSSYNETNPTGASSGQFRVLRGGSWADFASFCRSAFRSSDNPVSRRSYYGFRLVLPAVR